MEYQRESHNEYGKTDQGSSHANLAQKIKEAILAMKKIRAAITGINAWVPEYRLTNQELSKWLILPTNG
jgi:hypothetical protein